MSFIVRSMRNGLSIVTISMRVTASFYYRRDKTLMGELGSLVLFARMMIWLATFLLYIRLAYSKCQRAMFYVLAVGCSIQSPKSLGVLISILLVATHE